MRCLTSAVVLCLLLVSGTPALAGRIRLGDLVRKADPRTAINTAKQNYRDKRFYATDNSTHSTIRGAMKRSFFPTDPKANIQAAIKARFHWTRLIGAAVAPLSIEMQRQLAGGEGFDARRMWEAVDLKVMGTTFAGGVVGEVAGAAAQSGLARFGPWGAVAGFVARPLISFGASIMGYNIGRHAGAGFAAAVAGGLREIEPGRDLGQIAGYAFGAVIGQALIPIPVLGAIIGGTLGSLLGGNIGTWLGKGPLAGLSRAMKRGLGWLADLIEGKRDRAVAAAPPADPHSGKLSLLGVAAGAR